MLVKCIECSQDVSDSAKRCPQCGAKWPTLGSYVRNRGTWAAGWLLAAIIGAALIWFDITQAGGSAFLRLVAVALFFAGAVFFIGELVKFIWLSVSNRWEIAWESARSF